MEPSGQTETPRVSKASLETPAPLLFAPHRFNAVATVALMLGTVVLFVISSKNTPNAKVSYYLGSAMLAVLVGIVAYVPALVAYFVCHRSVRIGNIALSIDLGIWLTALLVAVHPLTH